MSDLGATKKKVNSVLSLVKSGHAKLDTIERIIKDSRGVDPEFSHILMMGQFKAEKSYDVELNKRILEKSDKELAAETREPEYLKTYLEKERTKEFKENEFLIHHYVPEVQKFSHDFTKKLETLNYEMEKNLNTDRSKSQLLSKTKALLGFSR